MCIDQYQQQHRQPASAQVVMCIDQYQQQTINFLLEAGAQMLSVSVIVSSSGSDHKRSSSPCGRRCANVRAVLILTPLDVSAADTARMKCGERVSHRRTEVIAGEKNV